MIVRYQYVETRTITFLVQGDTPEQVEARATVGSINFRLEKENVLKESERLDCQTIRIEERPYQDWELALEAQK